MKPINEALIKRFKRSKSKTMQAYMDWIRKENGCYREHSYYIITHLPDKEFTAVIRWLDEYSITNNSTHMWGTVIMSIGLEIIDNSGILYVEQVVKARSAENDTNDRLDATVQ